MANLIISSGVTSDGITLTNDSLIVQDGGTATHTTVNSGGCLYVSSGGTATDVVSAMKIVTMMNMELAQRLNQGNMLQGATLTIEAARALSDTAGITD